MSSLPATVNKGRIVKNISNADYHADKDSYSSSLLKMMNVPAKAKHYIDTPSETTENLSLGSAIHKWILEKDKFREDFLIGIDASRRGNADKQLWADWYTEHGADGGKVIDRPAAQWNAEFEAQTGKNLVTPETLKEIITMAESVAANKNAVQLFSEGESELSVYWQDDETGLNLRVRPDYLNTGFISDLKSCQGIDDKTIVRSISNFGYHISQAMYQDGIKQVTGSWRPFLFIFIDKTPPYLCRVIAINDDAQIRGWEKYKEYKRKLKHCIDSGEWPGIDDNLDFSLPEWALN